MPPIMGNLETCRAAALLCLLASWTAAAPARGQGGQPPESGEPPASLKPLSSMALPSVGETIRGMEVRTGLLDLVPDRDQGKLWLVLPGPGEDGEVGRYLYVEGLVQGLGSNPVGLDRGQLGETRVVRLRQLGGRLLVEELNLRFRAAVGSPEERRAAEESFATSVLWAGPVAARDPGGRFLVDFTGFVLRDAHDVVAKLRQTGQGSFALDPGRSALDLGACLAFPDNLELEGLLTYAFQPGKEEPGVHLAGTVPTPTSVTLRQHHSLIRLPDDGYRPRAFHPQSGFNDQRFADYGAGLDEPLERRFIQRHRLLKEAPEEARSRALKPIVFYLDPGTPEPVRSALMDGAGWWARAFEAAGFVDAYRVELLPPAAHPLDVRYNVIQWVHRSTRGWSYGGGVVDPRTGEILKGHVTLGSLRVRQDRLLFEGLLGTEKTGTGSADDPIELALARLRQLAAHEVGHALGLAHNFAASSYGRASVMDYPAPLVDLGPGSSLDVSRAYAVGVGAWDEQAIRYGYGDFGEEEGLALARILQEGRDRGLLFLSDDDARPPGAAHPLANLWDNGPDPLAALEQTLEVRRRALARFGAGNLPEGRPLALLEEVLAPLYFHHRYQVEATAKLLGGFEYTHAHRGREEGRLRPVSAERQRQALSVLLETLKPAELDLPDAVLEQLLPRPPGYPPNRELFAGRTAPAFDPLAAATTAASLTLGALLQPERAARLIDFHRRQGELPGFEEVLEAVVAEAFLAPPPGLRLGVGEEPRLRELRRSLQWTVVRSLTDLAAQPGAAPGVRERAEGTLRNLLQRLGRSRAQEEVEAAHQVALTAHIRRFLDRPWDPSSQPPAALEAPPGSPIGSAADLGACSGGLGG